VHRETYPNLFAPTHWATVSLQFALCDSPPPDDLISNVNIVPLIGDRCLVLRFASGDWEVPGGTLEPSETYFEAVQRELLEEAGARLITFNVFGAWHCHSSTTEPYRPHLPHPDFYRLAGYGQVEIVGSPSNPEGGEQVAAVECVSLDEAVHIFSQGGRPDLAELYSLAFTLAAGSQ
jgi:8-oxo-dGTP diphosphatase